MMTKISISPAYIASNLSTWPLDEPMLRSTYHDIVRDCDYRQVLVEFRRLSFDHARSFENFLKEFKLI